MEQVIFSRWFLKRLACLAVAAVLFACGLSAVLTHAVTSDGAPAWSMPNAMAMRQVSPTTGAQSEPTFLDNLDCSALTYRLAGSSTMQTGCFTDTAFGLMDSDSDTVIFTGTDEGIPLLPHTAHQILVPWPKAMDLIALDPAADDGTLISLYKNPLASAQDQHNLPGQVTAKQLTKAPDITLKDPLGKPLVINPQTVAFSEGGSWLIAETLGGSFIRVNLASLSMTAFAPAYGSQGSPALLKSRVTITEDGRFVAIANDYAAAFKVYDLATCDGVINNLRPQGCRSYDYWPFARQQITGLQSVRHLRFINEGLLSFAAFSGNPANGGTYELAPAGSITSLTDYVGLGDSYTSGEGAFDYLDGTDTLDNTCHLSRNSYPLLLTHDLFNSSGGHSVACSGAVINDVGSTSNSYRGQMRGVPNLQGLQQSQPLLLESVETNFLPGYVAQQRFIKRWQPRIVTVSIGGNDIGFGDLLQDCVEPHVSRHISDSTCYNTYEDRLELSKLADRTVPRWTALYSQLQRESPGMRLYAISYPQLVSDTGNCALNVQLNKSELEFAESIVDYLDQDIRKAALAAGIPYVDISQALNGHRLCETASYNVAVNGLTAGKDAGILGTKIFGRESYHPNALGQQLIEQAILKQTHNLAGTVSDNPSGTDHLPAVLNAPATGRPVNTLVFDNNLTSGVMSRGVNTFVQADGSADGLRPLTAYMIRLDGPGGSVLGTFTSDATGNLGGNVNLSPGTLPGGHNLDITGMNQAGEPVDVRQPIYITASGDDSDGDGIDDILDTCPGAINGGQDSDKDGIDDICDNLIGLPPGSGGAETISQGGALAPTETIVTSFSGINPGPSGNILGVGAVDPSSAGHVHGTIAINNKQASRTVRFRFKPVYWLYWLIFILLLWLILQYIQKGGFRLQ